MRSGRGRKKEGSKEMRMPSIVNTATKRNRTHKSPNFMLKF